MGRDSKLFRRLAQYGINVLTTPVLGTPNDFVVNTTRKQILPPGYENISKTLACTHTSFFTGARSAEKGKERVGDLVRVIFGYAALYRADRNC